MDVSYGKRPAFAGMAGMAFTLILGSSPGQDLGLCHEWVIKKLDQMVESIRAPRPHPHTPAISLRSIASPFASKGDGRSASTDLFFVVLKWLHGVEMGLLVDGFYVR